MSEPTVVGLRPWLPWPLSRSAWWTEPVRAERLAALRLGVAAVLLVDLLTSYLPRLADFYGRGSLADVARPDWQLPPPSWRWSLLTDVRDPAALQALGVLWALATLFLFAGLWTRASALAVWLLSTSFANLHPEVENAGDWVRGIALLYLVLSPCGAAWSLDRLRLGRRRPPGPVFVPPWPVRLLVLQLALIYFFNGLFKVAGPQWRAGESLYYVLGDLTLTRWSYAAFPVPFAVTRLLTWAVLAWELSFPALLCWGPTRRLALGLGVAFHLGIGLSLELGGFAFYMLCLYLPLVPWERWAGGPGVQLAGEKPGFSKKPGF